ncbi:MucR family transcriptional regulator [Methylobacterium sp. E-065]|uniref:MucR family transcriptional regulator n=1 Tax=Methylobacterium sp. E-065 TaxID=2836583 RepID=UPI001FB8B0FA|nr:MucR family transcriptional regulator [Methylobacterium sp. E-065]MCJ2019559.1 MucR family transcriptional regulator [Methylobacterium sp. E-065]
MSIQVENIDHIGLTTNLVAAYVSNNHIQPGEIGPLIASMHAALAGLGTPVAPAAESATKLTPGQIRKSITHDALISFEDGKPYKTLKRHLTKLRLSPEAYREKWGLPRDYPIVTASYSEIRSTLAKSIGLGSQHRTVISEDVEPAEAVPEQPKRVGRPKKTETAAKA